MRRFAHIFSVALVTAGLVVIADVGLTLVWKEPLSAVYGSVRQSEAASELNSVRDDFLRLPEVVEGPSGADTARRVATLADLFARSLEDAKPLGRIQIPSIDIDYVVVQGTSTAALQRGPGHYPGTALPGQGKTIGIAGHRTTYLAPFNKIDEIDVGDPIVLEMPYATLTYEVTDTRIVDPSQIGIVRNVGRERLVLTACHPLYSAAQRYAIFADLADVELAAGAGGS